MPVAIPRACSASCHACALRGADRVDVVDVAVVGQGGRSHDAAALEQLVVARRGRAARLGPLLEMAQLHAQHRALDALEPVVVALELVVVALLRAPVAQHADLPRVVGVVGDDHAAFAVGAEVLARVEAEAGHVAEAARALAACTRRRAPAPRPRSRAARACARSPGSAPCPPSGRTGGPGRIARVRGVIAASSGRGIHVEGLAGRCRRTPASRPRSGSRTPWRRT